MVQPYSIPRPPRIGLVHAVTPAIGPIHAAFDRQWPAAEIQDVLDDALPAALQQEGSQNASIRSRILGLARLASEAADAVLFTCTAFDDAIDAAASQVAVPLLKPNQAMFEEALTFGRRIGLLATFEPAVQPMEAALRALAWRRRVDVSVQTVCVDGALAAARAGDVPRHDELVAQAAGALSDCDVVLLAQFSTSTALQRVDRAIRPPVLSAPDSAVRALRTLLQAGR